MRRGAPSLAIALTVLLALPLAACGRRGPPVAPELRAPAPAADLTGVVRADGIAITWTAPGRRVDRTRLRDARVARVFRSEDSGAGEPRAALLERGRIRGYTEVVTLKLDAPAGAVIEGDRITIVDRQALTRDRRYTYVVLTEDATGRVSPPSSRLTVVYIAAPEPPRDLVAETGDATVRLAWAPSPRLVDGAVPGALRYEVLRAPAADAPLAPVPALTATTTSATDRGLENERTYAYAVRAVRTQAGTTAVSEPSARVTVTPADQTPPSAPRDLVAIPSERTVRLSWGPSPEPDVTRYVVYRAREGGDFTRAGSVAPPGTTFTDRDVPAGRYRYAVTAEDASSRRNESARSNDVTVSVP